VLPSGAMVERTEVEAQLRPAGAKGRVAPARVSSQADQNPAQNSPGSRRRAPPRPPDRQLDHAPKRLRRAPSAPRARRGSRGGPARARRGGRDGQQPVKVERAGPAQRCALGHEPPRASTASRSCPRGSARPQADACASIGGGGGEAACGTSARRAAVVVRPGNDARAGRVARNAVHRLWRAGDPQVVIEPVGVGRREGPRRRQPSLRRAPPVSGRVRITGRAASSRCRSRASRAGRSRASS
jgi:hypothetical protein